MKPFLGVFVVLTTFLGLLKSTESYLTTVVLKEELQSYQAIRDVMTDYYIIAAALTIAVSLSVGWLLRQKHVSPIILMTSYLVAMLIFLCVAAAIGELAAFLALSMARRVFEGCFFAPSMQITFNSMAGSPRSCCAVYASSFTLRSLVCPHVGSRFDLVALFRRSPGHLNGDASGVYYRRIGIYAFLS